MQMLSASSSALLLVAGAACLVHTGAAPLSHALAAVALVLGLLYVGDKARDQADKTFAVHHPPPEPSRRGKSTASPNKPDSGPLQLAIPSAEWADSGK